MLSILLYRSMSPRLVSMDSSNWTLLPLMLNLLYMSTPCFRMFVPTQLNPAPSMLNILYSEHTLSPNVLSTHLSQLNPIPLCWTLSLQWTHPVSWEMFILTQYNGEPCLPLCCILLYRVSHPVSQWWYSPSTSRIRAPSILNMWSTGPPCTPSRMFIRHPHNWTLLPLMLKVPTWTHPVSQSALIHTTESFILVESFSTGTPCPQEVGTHPHNWILLPLCWIKEVDPVSQGVGTHPHNWNLLPLCWILLYRNTPCLPGVLVLTHSTESFSLYVESFSTGAHPVSQGVGTHPHNWTLLPLCWILLYRNTPCLPGCWYSPTQLNPYPSMLNPSLQEHTLSPRVLVLTHTTEPFSLYVESFSTGTHPVSQGVGTHPHNWTLLPLCWILLYRNTPCLPGCWYSPTQLNPSPSMLNPSLQEHTLSPRVLVLTHTTEPFSLYVESFSTGAHPVSQGVETKLRTASIIHQTLVYVCEQRNKKT